MTRILILLLVSVSFASAESVNPEIRGLVDEVSAERIAASMRKLESFGTRDTNSSITDPAHGIGAARLWLEAELKSYSPRLQVSLDSYAVKKQGRVMRDLDVVNVVAVLPGRSQKDRHVIVGAHYDSLRLVRRQGEPGQAETIDWAASAAAPDAPGVSDNASGTALVLELARTMSRREWEKTLVFVLFAAEEQGLFGSRFYAGKLKSQNAAIDGMLNNDIIGNDTAGDGKKWSNVVHVFSAEPADSPSRALARYIRDSAALYCPAMIAEPVFRSDRFGRGGDHTPFAQQGYAAVRFTTAAENLPAQHTAADNFANSAPDYTARVARVNLAAAASLALAPPTPVVSRTTRNGAPGAPMLGRGKSGYDAVLRWTGEGSPDLAGYIVTVRSTTAPFWEREIAVGPVTEFTLPGVSIDDLVFGVKAIGRNGVQSPVAAYVMPERGPDR